MAIVIFVEYVACAIIAYRGTTCRMSNMILIKQTKDSELVAHPSVLSPCRWSPAALVVSQ